MKEFFKTLFMLTPFYKVKHYEFTGAIRKSDNALIMVDEHYRNWMKTD